MDRESTKNAKDEAQVLLAAAEKTRGTEVLRVVLSTQITMFSMFLSQDTELTALRERVIRLEAVKGRLITRISDLESVPMVIVE